MKRNITRKLISCLMVLCLSLTLIPPAAFAEAPQGETPETVWHISKSKTSENLDKDLNARITLSLPSAEEELTADIVFVLDESSCSQPVKQEMARMLTQLLEQQTKTDASIRVGAVQFRGQVTSLPLTQLSTETIEDIETFLGQRPAVGGSNMSMGILAGEKMLDEDETVSVDRKYMILVGDGITYTWDDPETEAQENLGINFSNLDTPDKPFRAGPDSWDVKYGAGFVPQSWLTHLDGLDPASAAEKISPYDRNVSVSGQPFVAPAEQAQYPSSVDLALLASYEAFRQASDKYHTFVRIAGVEREMETYPFGPAFMEFLSGGRQLTFDAIQREILYLVDAGSQVVDYMGYEADDYNFDFVNDPAALTLTVGQEAYEAVALEPNVYGFAPMEDGYGYVLTYIPGNLKEEERFVWEILVPVCNFTPVSLTYSVKLTDPHTEPGTYGVYDRDGSKAEEGLRTNNLAMLYPVSTDGTEGAMEAFPVPTVSYVVEKPEPAPTDPSTEPSTDPTTEPSTDPSAEPPTEPQKPVNPQTGDVSPVVLWITMVMLSLCAGVSLYFMKHQDINAG